jgi:methyltransferase
VTVAFTALVLAVAAQRLWEVRRSARHEARIIAAGGREHAAGQMAWMRAIHALWLAGMLAEAWLVRRTVPLWLVGIAAFAFLAGQALRLTAMRTLGSRWTVKVMTLPEPAVSNGIFRWLRHPNYLGVCLELVALPLLGGAYVTAGAASVANALLLRRRIAAEEAALRADSNYDAVFDAS